MPSGVWTLADGPDGSLYAGTGDGGRVVRVRDSGETDLFFDSPEVAVHAALFDRRGHLTIGTSPGGLVYRLDGDGSPGPHRRDRKPLRVGTSPLDGKGRVPRPPSGSPAEVVRLSADGRLDTLWSSSERHVMALLPSGKRLFASTAGPPPGR